MKAKFPLHGRIHDMALFKSFNWSEPFTPGRPRARTILWKTLSSVCKALSLQYLLYNPKPCLVFSHSFLTIPLHFQPLYLLFLWLFHFQFVLSLHNTASFFKVIFPVWTRIWSFLCLLAILACLLPWCWHQDEKIQHQELRLPSEYPNHRMRDFWEIRALLSCSKTWFWKQFF